MKKNIYNILRLIIIIVNILLSVIFIKTIDKLGMVPNKYFIIIISILVFINFISILLLLSKKTFKKILGIIISIIIIVLSTLGIKYGDELSSLVNKAFNNNKVEITGYIVAVLKNSDYDNLDDLDHKKMGYLDNKEEILDNIKSKLECEFISYENLYNLYETLLHNEIDALVIESAYLDLLDDRYDNIDDNIKIIYRFNVEDEIEQNNNKIEKLESINIFISGSDSRSDKLEEKTRSDVNMIMTVNPNTHTILLTSIPRDYYVQLHGTTGLKDKLTHAGIYGINMSKQTLEDLFDIKIDYTIKIGFKSVVEVVDLIGGIDVDSDKTFNSYHIKGWVVNEGVNHFDGKQALAYARERYAYIDGDIHRVQNQQQVLEAIITKIFNNKSILKKYDKLLASFSDLYRTDIPEDYIKLIVKNQLTDLKDWKLERQYVIGSNGSEQTYSMPGMNLYVMIPNQNSVDNARDKILSVYNGE